MAKVPRAPSDLKAKGRGRRFWSAVLADFDPRADEVEVLAEACRALDLLDALRTRIEADGLMVVLKSGPRMHPAVVESRLVRQELRLALASLGLSEPVEGERELPEGVARLRSQRARKAARARWDRDASGRA